MQSNPILAALAELDARAAGPPQTLEPPPERGRRRRGLKQEPRLVAPPRTAGISCMEARTLIPQTMRDYLAIDHPAHALLISFPPGVGKTFAAVRIAEECAARGLRVLYAGPRHAFFLDVIGCAEHPGWWYEWLPRQIEDEATDKPETCRYAPEMTNWLVRGYDAMDFCSGVCGWDYINAGCGYHAQKKVAHPIIFGQHQHVVGGHILMKDFDVLIGDEYPLGVFLHDWLIPGRYIVPSHLQLEEPITEILIKLRSLAESDGCFDGPTLLDLIGGASAVREACDLYEPSADHDPRIFRPTDVEFADYKHLPDLLHWLGIEARAAEQGIAYEPRVIIAHGELLLLLRHVANAELPAHRIWLDATADARLYERVIDWPIEQVKPHVKLLGPVYQVWDSANTRSALVENGKPAAKAHRTRLQVEQIIREHGYQNPLIVSYSQLDELFKSYNFAYFYGNRGTNKYEDCDAVIIIGTPQPATTAIVKDARMLFIERQHVFNAEWIEKDVPFSHYQDQHGMAYSGVVSGFWSDDDLQLILEQLRNAEIVQCAHRVRPVLSPKPIWLLTSLPVDDLPPTHLMSVRELFRAPQGVDPYLWPAIVELAYQKLSERGYITAADYVDALGVQRVAANRYLDQLMIQFPDDFQSIVVKAAGRGRPPKAAGCGNCG